MIFYALNLALSFVSRKLFLESLSAEFIGLTTTLNGFLSFLNLAELGVGAAIGYLLYKPIYDKNQGAICEIVSVFGYIYKQVGRFILVAGVVLSLFFPLIFAKTDYSFAVIYFAFYCYLASSMLGYFVNYRQVLLSADQRNYLVSAYSQSAGIACYVLQMVLVYVTKSPYVWLGVNLLTAALNCIILNWKINQIYPWLKTNVKSGKELLKKYPEVMQKTKQVFVHRVATFAQYQITPSLIYAFESLTVVAYYGNYTIVVSKITILFGKFFEGINAGIGNLIAEGDKSNTMKVYWEMYTLDFFIAGFAIFNIYVLINPFIELWLGAEYLLDDVVVMLMLGVSFINLTRTTTDRFISAHGMFSDVWAPFVETILCVLISIACGYVWGLKGVLVGNIVSMAVIICIWKPYFLFHDGFKESVLRYWFNWGVHIACLLSAMIVSSHLLSYVHIDPYVGYWDWILYGCISAPLFSVIYITLLIIFTQGARSFVSRLLGYVKRFITKF
ncbi:MAG: sugar transporter [Rikenellaceae bacterium]